MKTLSALLLCLVTLVLSVADSVMAAAPAAQVEFFQHIATGDVTQVMSVIAPELKTEIDAPVLEAWITAFNDRLGPVTQLTLTGWTRRDTANGLVVETRCDVTCERGDAASTLTVLKGKVIGFHVGSEQMANFFTGPTSNDIYAQLGKEFIREFLAENAPAAHAMCHEALREVISLDELTQMIPLVTSRVGHLNDISLIGTRMEQGDDDQKLLLDFQVAGSEGSVTCEIKIEFVGLKGYLLGFDFQLTP